MAMEYEWAGDVKRGGLFLRRLREAHDWTQRDLEKKTGLLFSASYISAIETGIVGKPPMAALCKLGAALGVTPNEIAEAFDFWHPEQVSREEEEEVTYLRQVLRQATPAQRYSLLQSVRALASVAERQL